MRLRAFPAKEEMALFLRIALVLAPYAIYAQGALPITSAPRPCATNFKI